MESSADIKVTVFGKTDVGLVREHNEDSFLIADATLDKRESEPREPIEIPVGPKGALLLVCDGMGGAAAGEVASQMAVESISTALASAEAQPRDGFARRLRRAIEDANDRIYAQSRDNQSERGMGTTCTAVGLVDGTLVLGQIGDSRCYVLRDGKLAQVTKDQSLAWQLIEAGAMTAEEAKQFEHANIILQALGVQERVDVALSQVPLRQGDVVLVSSDGLHGPVSDEEILQVLKEESDVKRACDRLVARALEREGPDNITVVVARFDGPSLPPPAPEDLVSFVAYDPGPDPNEPVKPTKAETQEKVTVEVTIPKEVIGLTGGEDRAPAAPLGAGARSSANARSLLTFIFLTLVAAAAGAVFLKYERSRALEQEARATSAFLKGSSDPAA
ncbi:MAG TPA: Stp1/IreP family PP2C-type Ser/Thr phosphatase, partial [Polyangia bacterium]|nr:Stp1/IreP family PP2C-type Ser/Thr phosphatase [Polyangia bacterium]